MDNQRHLRVRLSPEIKDAFEAFAESQSITHAAAIERLLRFFLAQSTVTQLCILGKLKIDDDLGKVIAKQLVGGEDFA